MRVVSLVVVVSLLGCAPMVGDQCVGTAVCATQNKNAALFCEGGVFEDYECAGGCSSTGDEVNKDRVFCDFAGNRDDSPCPAFFSGQGKCEPAGTLIKCETNRRWKRYQCPGGCVTANGQLECKP